MTAALSPASDPAVRRTGIGGSDMPALVGEDRFGRTPYDVFLEKRGEAPPREFSSEQAEIMEWGNILEDPVARAFARRENKRIARVNETVVHREFPFLIGHPDRRIVGEPAGLEVKTTSLWNAADWNIDDSANLPVSVTLQVQWYMELTGWERWFTAALIGGQHMKTFVAERDPAMGQILVAIAVNFWQDHVLTGIPPAATSCEEVRRRYPIAISVPIEADAEAERALADYVAAKRAEKQAKEEVEAAQDALATYLTEHDTLTVGGKPALTFKTQTSHRVDTKSLEFVYPDIHAAFTRPSSTRVMRVAKGFF